jgi:hypothetical protein
MTTDNPDTVPRVHPLLRLLRRKNVLAGLMFIGIAVLGLWISRAYPVGTALRMSTGYVPRLLCWMLMGLGAVVLWQGLREVDAPASSQAEAPDAPPPERGTVLWPIVMVTAGLIAFALALERLGLMLAILLMVTIAGFANHELKFREALAAMAVLCALSWAIFVFGLGLPIPLWPDW